MDKDKKIFCRHATVLACFSTAEVFRKNGTDRLYWRGKYVPPGIELSDDTIEAPVVRDVLRANYCYPHKMNYHENFPAFYDVIKKVAYEIIARRVKIADDVLAAISYMLSIANHDANNITSLAYPTNIDPVKPERKRPEKPNLNEILEADNSAAMLFTDIKQVIFAQYGVNIRRKDMDAAGFSSENHILPNGSAGYRVKFRINKPITK